jgi:hypothetical protein
MTAASMAGPSGTARGDALMWMAARTSFMVPPAWGQGKKGTDFFYPVVWKQFRRPSSINAESLITICILEQFHLGQSDVADPSTGFKLHEHIHIAFRPEVLPENRSEKG